MPGPKPDDLMAQPTDAALTLPARYYAHSRSAQLDRRAVFCRSWQLVARADQVAGAGDHALAEIAGVPLLIVRDAHGVLRALHNVCRHRAGPLAVDDGRGAQQFVCRYHGWRYGLDGRLLGAPDMGRAPDFDVKKICLPQARVAAWQGMVFAVIDQDAPPFEALVDGIAARLGSLALADYRFERRVHYELACNWKVYVDNYLEGYHVPHVHPALDRLLDSRHYSMSNARWHSLQACPLEAGTGPYRAGAALYYWLYPNTMLNILPDRLQTNRVVPIAADCCRVEFDYYYASAVAPEQRERDLHFSDQVQREDSAICEAVQRGLASGSYVAGRLNPERESALWHFHELLRCAYRDHRDEAGGVSA